MFKELVECPKCHSPNAYHVADEFDITLRCLCGYHKVVKTVLGAMTIEHIDAADDVSLPRRNSNLYACLVMLIGMVEATTGEIAGMLNCGKRSRHSNSDVASQLTQLRYKGLADVPNGSERKGVAGGSTWVPTPAALRLFKGVR